MIKYIKSISQISIEECYEAILKNQSLVYCAFINEFDISIYPDILSDVDMKRVNEFIKFDDKMRSIVGRMIIRQSLSLIMQIKPSSVEILVNKFGKPFCKNGICHFSISHSNKCVVVALNSRLVGVDVEFVKSGIYWADIAQTIFSDKECRWLLQNDNEQKYFMTWVCKEAIGKLIGCGLNQKLLKTFNIENIDFGLNIINRNEVEYGIINIFEIADKYIMALAERTMPVR